MWLFTLSDGGPLTRQQLPSTVQSILHSAAYTGSYSDHSFSIEAATMAAARGVPDYLIKTLGRWSSDAYQSYTHTPVGSIVHVSRQLVAEQVPPLPLGLPWGWVPQAWALGAWGSVAPSPLGCSGFFTFRLSAGELVAGLRIGRPVVFFRLGV